MNMKSLKIVIITAYYYPLNVPRAFRATELAHEFARKGHQVTVINAINVINNNGDLLSVDDTPNIRLVNLGVFNHQINTQIKVKVPKRKILSYIKQKIKKKLFYLFTNKWLQLYWMARTRLKFDQKYDLLISIGLPFAIHWAVSYKIKKQNIADCYIADYGDPFSKFNVAIKVAPYFQLIEKKCITRFDYITIPTVQAIDSYKWLKDEIHIRVIPQGFNFSTIKLAKYISNPVPTFAFAGLFYSDIRNPRVFLDFLSSLDLDFQFIIYTNIHVEDNMRCITSYIRTLNRKIIIINTIPRDKLISELSKMDFLINIENLSKNQNPSKLIDYALARRPILSFSPNTFNSKHFMNFYHGLYDDSTNVDLSSFNIVNVANQFLSLYTNDIY